jgi:hypothetical protein
MEEEGASPQALDAAWEARWQVAKTISLLFGAAMVALAFWVGLRTRRVPDFAFWLYLFGVLAFWGGLTAMHSDSEWARLGYPGIDVVMILLGAILGWRRAQKPARAPSTAAAPSPRASAADAGPARPAAA